MIDCAYLEEKERTNRGGLISYAKTAHNKGGAYVFDSLLSSLGKTATGSTVVTVKNWLT